MRHWSTRVHTAIFVALTLCLEACVATDRRGDQAPTASASSTSIDPLEVEATIRKVADRQLHHPIRLDPRNWIMTPLYNGLISTSEVTDDAKYLASVLKDGWSVAWEPGPSTYHADDLAAGQIWLRIYLLDPKDPSLLRPIQRRMDEILQQPISENLSFIVSPITQGVTATDRWTWIDALYMAPPALSFLTRATGDARYLDFIDREFRFTYDRLYDDTEHLFFRDARFISQRSPESKKIFWSRGNGWVYASLPTLLDTMPADRSTRPFYEQLFREMSEALRATQQPDGMWYASMLEPKLIPVPEASGTALFVYGLAWGVGNGMLERETYWPMVERGSKALSGVVEPDGAVTHVQPVGAAPEPFDPKSQAPYGTGALLSAGAQILRTMGAARPTQGSQLLSAAWREFPDAPFIASRIRIPEGLSTGPADRAFTVRTMIEIAHPVLDAVSRGELHERLPVHGWEQHRKAWTHYEAFARTLAGIAPWIELGPDDTPEGQLRTHSIELARSGLINATDPRSPDYMNFGQVPDQPLVESAYLAYALLRAPGQLWEPLTAEQRANVIAALKLSRTIPFQHDNNWYLMPAMIETAIARYAGEREADLRRIVTGVNKFEGWYLGDGVYGDGPYFHWDYYDSYVIQPFLLQVLQVAADMNQPLGRKLPLARQRGERYAEVLERFISPEGSFPVMGRSSAYRFGAFFHLSDMALKRQLPEQLERSAVRGAITMVVRRQMDDPDTFDQQGWLQLGAVGHQPGLTEPYNATGSLYMCLTGLVHLGLPADDPYWTEEAAPWTQRKIWAGTDVQRDQALENRLKGK